MTIYTYAHMEFNDHDFILFIDRLLLNNKLGSVLDKKFMRCSDDNDYDQSTHTEV